MTIDDFRKEALPRLEMLYDSGEAEAMLAYLIEGILGYSLTEISIHKRSPLSEKQAKDLQAALKRLLLHEPVQYVTGVAYFWDLILRVTPDVLIPRQETEELVDWILKENRQSNLSILDIGTGSGCIALSLALEMKNADVTALDYSAAALRIAQQNAAKHQAKITFRQQDILQASPDTFSKLDIIVSNPPYIKHLEKEAMMPHVLDHEPGEALFVPDEDPLLFYRKIGELGQHWLCQAGKLYVEINEAYGKEVVELLQALNYEEVELRQDLNGRDRMVKARISS
jgi:release factor glutamine methyltransferase